MKTSALRDKYVHAHGVVLQSLGIVGREVIQRFTAWEAQLSRINQIDWLRTNPMWHGSAIVQGKMSKSTQSVAMTATIIRRELGIIPNDDEITLRNSVAGEAN
jgi:DNA sulfur modification protein DndB